MTDGAWYLILGAAFVFAAGHFCGRAPFEKWPFLGMMGFVVMIMAGIIDLVVGHDVILEGLTSVPLTLVIPLAVLQLMMVGFMIGGSVATTWRK